MEKKPKHFFRVSQFSVGHIFCSGFLQMEREAAIFIEGRNVTNVVDHKDEPNISSGRPVNSDWQRHVETAVFGVMRRTKTSNALSRTGTELLCWMHFLFLLLKSHKLYITL